MKLTDAARGQACTIAVPNFCNGNPDTTIAAHYRSVSFGAGMGKKPPDILCAHACSDCHDCIDGRVRTPYTRNELRLMHAEGVLRTILRLSAMGLIQVGE